MPRRFLTINEKENLIRDHQKGAKTLDLWSKYKFDRSTVFRVLNNQQEIVEAKAKGVGSKSRIEKNHEMLAHDNEVVKFIEKCQEIGIPLTARIIKEEGLRIANAMGRETLKCSSMWWTRFRERVKIKHGNLCGESKSVNMEVVYSWNKNEIPRIIINWQKFFIYNCDETGLFWKQTPIKTYFITKTTHNGDKLFKERISILFCVNLAGEKLFPLVIGKAATPRCFYSNCLDNLEITQ